MLSNTLKLNFCYLKVVNNGSWIYSKKSWDYMINHNKNEDENHLDTA